METTSRIRIPPNGILAASQVVDERQAAAYLSLSVKTLQARRAAHRAPPFLKIGRSVRYRLQDLDDFLSAHRIAFGGQGDKGGRHG